ncbi:citrate transporter [Proteiniclasticum sp. BAD-10]|uniref:Citrate transporter n=1 Tax=Proteiniclasticum sediminis TaxID=2804028 RepID=A0A941CTT7_9CLOT|nr:citrate:proton symporter [Proteiniclasticum sediminis]MBR0577444.1 citrate transporter [Proteiniclasticum sediminis]
MLTFIALAMILVFILSLSMRKLNVFGALTIVPFVFGVIAALVKGKSVLDVFTWIKNGIFYTQNATTGKVSMGVISPAIIILFAVLFFGVMLYAGLFDPLSEFFIKKAKGDPLKVTLATVLVASVVTLNGDTTTTIIIVIAAFLSLWKQMNMKLIYLAIIVVTPIGIFNQLPWGGPTIAAATALDVEISTLFASILPGMLVAEVYAIFMAYWLGKKERKRLNFDPKTTAELHPEVLQEMLNAIRENEPEKKRPKLFWFNLGLTILVLTLLLMDVVHGSVLFMLGTAIALKVNYWDVPTAKGILDDLAPDALPPALATLAAGAFSGILGGSGMSAALATSIAGIIPSGLGAHMAPIYAIIAAPAITFLPQDAFYFGIASVLAGVMGQFGISPDQAAVASMVGQSFRLISPVIPALYMLCERTETNFVDFQKEYTKYAWPILFIYLIVHTVTGAMPL